MNVFIYYKTCMPLTMASCDRNYILSDGERFRRLLGARVRAHRPADRISAESNRFSSRTNRNAWLERKQRFTQVRILCLSNGLHITFSVLSRYPAGPNQSYGSLVLIRILLDPNEESYIILAISNPFLELIPNLSPASLARRH